MKKIYFMIVLLVTAFSLKAQVTEEEFQALKAFYNATGGDSWTDRTGWENINTTATKDDVTTRWKGILYISDEHVTNLNFYNNNLTGTLPDEIGNLELLRNLALNSNHLSGPLPSTLKQLSLLTVFAMAGNNLNVPFPSDLIKCWPDLGALNLSYCGITGSIPDIFESVPNLWDLEINNNYLEGELPPSLDSLNLHEFHCDNNQFEGPLPRLTNSVDIYRLSFSNNNFTGTIPEHYGDFDLQYFQIDNNKLFGAIPEKLFATPIYLLTINGNYFTFADIEPVFGKIIESENKYYAPSKDLPLVIDSVILNEDETLTLDVSALSVYGLGGSNNRYKWFCNNVEVYSGSSPVYSVSSVATANAGTYRFEVTNSVVTDLTLKSKNLVVTVKKVNHNPTNITLSENSVAENYEGLVGNLSATDPDAGDTHTYSLIKGDGTTDKDNALFTITGNQLFLKDSVDYENVKTLNVMIAAFDGNGGSVTKAFAIAVNNVNETPRFLRQVTSASIDETAQNGTLVALLTATDPENDALMFAVKQGNENGAFGITGDRLVVTDSSKLDYETKKEYPLVVTVSDGKLLSEITITVSIKDVLERYVITASGVPQVGGTVSIPSAVYLSGDSVAIVATPATDYEFVNWTENGVEVSALANYSFVVHSDRNLVANFRQKIVNVTLSLSANPTEGGTVSGAGVVVSGSSVTVIATPATGYEFVNWTENGKEVSASANYTFTAISDRALMANFRLETFTVTLSANNKSYGYTNFSTKTFDYGEKATISAQPNWQYKFVNWTENEVVVSTEASYSFLVDANRNLVANFQQTTGITDWDYSEVNVYPNPATDYFVVDGIDAGSEIVMTTLSGAIVSRSLAGDGVARIDIRNYKRGVYFVIVGNDNQKVVRKLVIE